MAGHNIKKRTRSTVVAEGQARKTRKAARASMEKTKKIVEAETESKVEDVDDTEQLDKNDHLAEGDATAVSQGFHDWRTSSRSLVGNTFQDIAKFNTLAGSFTHKVEIQHNEAFVLKPAIPLHGPFSGCRIIVLDTPPGYKSEPSKPFRFLDLASEIRTMILKELLVEHSKISIIGYKAAGRMRRPVRREFFNHKPSNTRTGGGWDLQDGKWIGQTPSNLAIIGTCKQLRAEAAHITYGSNTFSFTKSTDMRLFGHYVGSMRKYIQNIAICTDLKFFRGFGDAFLVFKDAKKLRKISLDHRAFCHEQGYRIENFSHTLARIIRSLFEANPNTESYEELLSIFVIDCSELCSRCARQSQPCFGEGGYEPPCSTHQRHNQTLTQELLHYTSEKLNADG